MNFKGVRLKQCINENDVSDAKKHFGEYDSKL
jgi:hypothetical protein